jgi:hypothetical protein
VGMFKQGLLEEAEDDRRQEVREWLQDKLQRLVSEQEIDAAWDDFELEEAFAEAMSSD